jgi:hypothetical protein
VTAAGPTDERILTARLKLVPVVADDADELIEVFGDQRLYVFLGDRAAQLDGAPTRRRPGGGHAAGGLLRPGPRR